jgi:glycosyltransferase involved in cell wall biosynthesis
VTSRGGASEFIDDGINGFLRDPDDIAGMVEIAVKVLADDVMRAQMVDEGRRVAAADFGAPCVVRQYLELYDRLLARGGSRSGGLLTDAE